MKIVVLSAGLAIVGLFAFQNCNKVPTASSAQSSDQSVSKYNLPVADISNVSFYVADTTTVNKSGKIFSLKYNKTLKVDLDTGEIQESNDVNPDTATYCMPEDVLQELISIFESSQVCKVQVTSSPDQVCTQIYKTPYCEVTVGNDVTALGSATDGCGNNAVDLCDGQDLVLKAFIQKLNSNYPSYKCSPI